LAEEKKRNKLEREGVGQGAIEMHLQHIFSRESFKVALSFRVNFFVMAAMRIPRSRCCTERNLLKILDGV